MAANLNAFWHFASIKWLKYVHSLVAYVILKNCYIEYRFKLLKMYLDDNLKSNLAVWVLEIVRSTDLNLQTFCYHYFYLQVWLFFPSYYDNHFLFVECNSFYVLRMTIWACAYAGLTAVLGDGRLDWQATEIK